MNSKEDGGDRDNGEGEAAINHGGEGDWFAFMKINYLKLYPQITGEIYYKVIFKYYAGIRE